MTTQLSPDEFVSTNPWTGEVVHDGRKELADFGFNPDTCKITVDDDDTLCVEQEDYNTTLYCSSKHWRRVSSVK